MQIPPLTFNNFSLLIAVATISLLFVAEILSPYYGQTTLLINKKKFKNAALITGFVFLIFVSVRVIGIIA